MAVVFERSVFSSVVEKILLLLIVLFVGGAFSSLFFLVDDRPVMIDIFSAGAVLLAIFFLTKVTREIIALVKSGKPWRVEITNQALTWESPVQEQMKSLMTSLSDIRAVRKTHHRYRNSKRSPKTKYHIDFENGQQLEIKAQMCGISPEKVFSALEEKGIPFHRNQNVSGPKFKVGVDGTSVGVGR
ncbi:MAG: hypothetical protein ACRBM6_30715 [Geminicoccales bacterium]